ncbi:hypothetical protein [Desulfospira joergensenii]|uniref:hypothetical protein n=1 Tax=Desulfospira joergensenii TaxID=53329 RepID=UPI0003B2F5CA|nr:hypothetical protein [Desulfospira joergensenii]
MIYVFTFIFILSLAAGWTLARFMELSASGTLACLAGAGFAGSSIIALVFVFLYFFHKETDKEKIERLQEEIKAMKKRPVKRIES